MNEGCTSVQIMGASGEANPEQKLSTLTLQRQQRLADIVKRDKFILVSDIPSFFQARPATFPVLDSAAHFTLQSFSRLCRQLPRLDFPAQRMTLVCMQQR